MWIRSQQNFHNWAYSFSMVSNLQTGFLTSYMHNMEKKYSFYKNKSLFFSNWTDKKIMLVIQSIFDQNCQLLCYSELPNTFQFSYTKGIYHNMYAVLSAITILNKSAYPPFPFPFSWSTNFDLKDWSPTVWSLIWVSKTGFSLFISWEPAAWSTLKLSNYRSTASCGEQEESPVWTSVRMNLFPEAIK